MEVRKVKCVYSEETITVDDVRFRTPEDVVNLLQDEILQYPDEHAYVILTNAKNQMLHYEDISHGTLSTCLSYPRNVFRSAIILNAAAVIFVHNHPSGDPTPSADDIALTGRLRDAGEIVGVHLLDSIIIASRGYVSLKAQGIV
jgi:DNA repair protein RadC